jgi:hypothetical protein
VLGVVKRKGKLVKGKEAVQHTLGRLQLSVKQGRAGMVSRLQQSRSDVTSIGKKMVKGMVRHFGRKRHDDPFIAAAASAGAVAGAGAGSDGMGVGATPLAASVQPVLPAPLGSHGSAPEGEVEVELAGPLHTRRMSTTSTTRGSSVASQGAVRSAARAVAVLVDPPPHPSLTLASRLGCVM